MLQSPNRIYIIKGGATRNLSTFNALKFIESKWLKNRKSANKDSKNPQNLNPNLYIHDSARPLLDSMILESCIKYMDSYQALDVAIPAIDTIIECEDGFIKSIPKRANLMQGQTPQCFKYDLLLNAYKLAFKQNKNLDTFSDDCGLLKAYMPHIPIFVVRGSYANLKLTRLEDVPLIDNLFMLKSVSLDSKLDSKKLKNSVIVVFGGTSGIGAKIITLGQKFGAKTYALSRKNGCDITHFREVKRHLNEISKIEGKIDLIINMAGILHKDLLTNTTQSTINTLININYKGSINIAKAAFSHLKKSKGMLILTSSSSYSRGREEYCIYSSLKAAIINLTQALSDEWSGEVALNCIVPERTRTPMRLKAFGKENLDDLLEPEYVAKRCLELYTLDSNIMESNPHITGIILNIKRQDMNV